MPNTFGTATKITFLKEIEAHKIHEEFEVEGLYQLLTFSGVLVTSNVVNGVVGGTALSATTFATDNDTTMAVIAAKIAAVAGVKSATVIDAGTSDVVIKIIPEDQVGGIGLNGFVVTAGAGQATITPSVVNNKVYAGMPVEMDSTTGKIQPVTVASCDLNCIGYAIQDGVEGELCTVALRGFGIIYARSASAMGYVPVKFDSYDETNGYNKVEDGSVTVANQMGWSLDTATGADETIRVILK